MSNLIPHQIASPEILEGWGWPGLSKKAHYFKDHRSLCRKWLFGGALEPHTGSFGPDDCVGCKKKLAARAALSAEGRDSNSNRKEG